MNPFEPFMSSHDTPEANPSSPNHALTTGPMSAAHPPTMHSPTMHSPTTQSPTTQSPTMQSPGGDSQWLQSIPAMRRDLRFEIRKSENCVHYLIEDLARNKYYEIGTSEFEFINSVDGTRNVEQIIEYVNKNAVDGNHLDQDSAQRIFNWLTTANMIQSDCIQSTTRMVQMNRQLRSRRWMTFVNPITFKIPLFDPDKLLTKCLPFVSWFFSKPFLMVWLFVVSLGVLKWIENFDGVSQASNGILAGGRWIWLLVCWSGLKVIHEAGHGLACKRFGGRATETGVLMLLFTPLAYIDVSSSWRLNNKWKRMAISAAGMYVEIFVAAISMILWASTSSKFVADICFNLFLMAGVTTVLFNANPLMRFDGYYILADAIGITNLYTRGQKQLLTLVKQFIGMPVDQAVIMDRKGWILLTYGSLSFVWRISISVGLIIGASALFSGFGLVFGLLGAVLWLGVPLYKASKAFISSVKSKTLNRRRFAIAVAWSACSVVLLFAVISAPATKSAPAIVKFKDESELRTDASGFLESVHVKNGQLVSKGDLLFTFKNPEVRAEVSDLELEIQQSHIRFRVLRQEGRYAESQMESERLASLAKQLEEKRLEVSSLHMKAPHDGVVFARDMANQIGIYYKTGDPVATLAESSNKEIIVAFEQTDLDGVKSNFAETVHLGFPGVQMMQCHMDRMVPRASDRPIDPSLTAAYGGYLPVQPVADKNDPDPNSLRLLNHHFSVTVKLSPEQGRILAPGQRGFAYYKTTRQSLGIYFYVESRQWLRDQIGILTANRGF